MSRIAYVNGSYVHKREAAVHIEDRAHQLADSVYEGVQIYKGVMIDLEPHLDRLWRSMDELHMVEPMKRGPMRLVLTELIRRNHTQNGFLYIQVSRGVAPRDHAFPDSIFPSFTATVKAANIDAIRKRAEKGVAAITHPDIRWGRCDIKTTNILANCMAKTEAKKAGAFEAILYDDSGFITEGSSTNIWIVNKNNELQTRPLSDNILPGITRMRTITVAEALQIKVRDEKFNLEDLKAAKEVFLTSSSAGPIPITNVDDEAIADGKTGPVSKKLVEAYFNYCNSQV